MFTHNQVPLSKDNAARSTKEKKREREGATEEKSEKRPYLRILTQTIYNHGSYLRGVCI
jgi:hypothetical protein